MATTGTRPRLLIPTEPARGTTGKILIPDLARTPFRSSVRPSSPFNSTAIFGGFLVIVISI